MIENLFRVFYEIRVNFLSILCFFCVWTISCLIMQVAVEFSLNSMNFDVESAFLIILFLFSLVLIIFTFILVLKVSFIIITFFVEARFLCYEFSIANFSKTIFYLFIINLFDFIPRQSFRPLQCCLSALS